MTSTSFKYLFRKALQKADEVRDNLGLDMFEPMNIFDSCVSLDITVRFVDISMEGMYFRHDTSENATILISSLRPFPRRFFTGAHELGHHVFNHGNKIDGLLELGIENDNQDEDEFLVDCFAGALLMPIAGIEAEFINRNWTPTKATPIQFYTISSIFGTGYSTLITHCKANGIIDNSKALSLLKYNPAKILKNLFSIGVPNAHFKIIDGISPIKVIDLEVNNYIILPKDTEVEGSNLERKMGTTLGAAFIATKPGIVRVISKEKGLKAFVRIQSFQYVGLAQYRHLENTTT